MQVGLSFTCALGVAALLESAVGFCLGCFFFSIMVQIGLMPADIYVVFTNTCVCACMCVQALNSSYVHVVVFEGVLGLECSWPDCRWSSEPKPLTTRPQNLNPMLRSRKHGPSH